MNPIFTSSLAAARRKMKRHQQVPPARRVPLARLLVGEAVYALRQLARPQRGVPALIMASLVTLALSPATPGPVAATPLLVVLAVAAAAIAGFFGARLFDPPAVSVRVPTDLLRGAVWGIGTVVVFALLFIAVGWLMAAVVVFIF